MTKRILKNFGRVLSGRGIAGICSVMATGLMAHALPVEQFGLVVLLHTYVKTVKGLISVRAFEAIVRYGVPLQEKGDKAGLMSLLRAMLVLDLSTTVFAVLIAVTVVPLAAQMLHWDATMSDWALLYSLLLLSTPTYTSNGILRLYDRFDILGLQYIIDPAVRVLLFALVWALDGGIVWFVLARGTAFCIGNLNMLAQGFLELRRHDPVPFWRGFGWRDISSRGREFWIFIGVVYWQTGIDLLPKHFSTLVAGSLLGPAAAGLFQFAREISSVLTQPALMLREVLFPDLTRAWHAGREGFNRLPFRTALIAGGAGLALVVFALIAGKSILGVIGDDYIAAQPLMVLLLLAASFELSSASLRAAAYAMGRATNLLRIHVWGVVTYVVAFLLLTNLLGLIGAGLATIITSLLTLWLTVVLLRVKSVHADFPARPET
jgi:O-antigen/teichoic acid export membrane protein